MRNERRKREWRETEKKGDKKMIEDEEGRI